MRNYPGDAIGVALAVQGNDLYVTVRTSTGKVAQAKCVIEPRPGIGNNPRWPGNCEPFVDEAPPN